jgi:nitroreductase/NAD-dependent dihydropyrimidine dehydrogenase PreA subunit
MSQISVDTRLCKQDGACVEVCPSRNLALNVRGYPEEVTEGRCILCGHCVAVCPTNALTHNGLPDEPFLPAPKRLPAPALIDGFLMSRRSVRTFRKRPVDRETLEAVLDVARRAPTATNSQSLHWIVVADAEKVRALSEETMNWLRISGTNQALLERWEKFGKAGYDFILRGAPALIVVCAPAEYEWAKQDGAIALAFLELAAAARGLGACWAGYLTRVAGEHAPLRHALSVPEGYAVCGGLMLGYRKFVYRRIPPRRPLSVQWI